MNDQFKNDQFNVKNANIKYSSLQRKISLIKRKKDLSPSFSYTFRMFQLFFILAKY